MKAMVLERPNELVLKTIEDPSAKEGEVLIRNTHSGICGSDAKIYQGKMPARYPLVLGHEIVGEGIDGDITSSAKPGTRVIVDPVIFCGNCFYCNQNETHLCPNGVLMGREINGGFADYCVVKNSHIYPLPDELESETSAAVQVLTTVLHAQDKGEVGADQTVVVSGLGVTGLMHIQLAKTRGAKTVIGISRNFHKRKIGVSLGADYVFSHGIEAKNAVLDLTGGVGADIIIECVGHLTLLGEAVALARPGGRIIPFGVYPSEKIELPFYDFYFKELEITNVRAAKGRDFSESIELVKQGKINIVALITHTRPITELDNAIQMLTEPSDKRIKIIMESL